MPVLMAGDIGCHEQFCPWQTVVNLIANRRFMNDFPDVQVPEIPGAYHLSAVQGIVVHRMYQ
jgi:hypothetical protein